ncbi:MAG: 3-isopropylmalate dehydratase [Desulfurococcales archaeon]|nr:3-isopropylmalate dehydratase [Desulfurococcales archaeon]
MRVTGYAFKLGDNISTDDIIAGRYLYITDPGELAMHIFENRPEIRSRILRARRPIVIVAGRGFGYGSSREHAPLALKAFGVKAIVVDSFHRIFYRNSINNGLLAVEAPGVHDLVEEGEMVTIDLDRGVVESSRGIIHIGEVPGYVRGILEAGGLREVLRRLAGSQRV